ncbi:putative DNA polymerase alpha catalytic subunit-like [Penaeus vannamei]|uniref:DNA polymerase n=1 Tax=Penaeus vannamei TaxID=6689 RepID=A0A3R7SYW8_PENVA|nr:DNA polymerase alpha catalytic subunit-like [Penaeus vannamei]ROT82337.1 putative DNA polymerase alpha catalytic subunit-like [Penaeus vannamei]
MDADGDAASPSAAESLATSRSKRSRKDKHGRFAALEKLRELKGSKHKYEVSELVNVYEEVDEREYSQRRQDRLEDDWIVDDDGSGYVEDGREIFDDDAGEDDLFVGKKAKKGGKRKEVGGKASSGSVGRQGAGNIKNMLINMPAKKKRAETNIRLDDDELLGDILQDLDKESDTIRPPMPTLLKKKVPKPPSASPVNPFARPQVTTPVRVKASPKPLKPRTILDENVVNGASPKAKRSLEVKEEPLSEQIDEFDSMDVMDMDFDDEDVENMEAMLVNEEKKAAIKLEKEEPKEELKEVKEEPQVKEVKAEVKTQVNRGFTAKPKVDVAQVTTGWETVKDEVKDASIVQDVQIDASKLPLTTNSEGEQVLRFYWLDAYEDIYKQPGTVYLFGKVWIESAQTHTSCCVAVKNIERRLYILPRTKRMDLKTKEESEDPVGMMEVYQEFNSTVVQKYKILEFKSKKAKKNYAFEKFDVPNTADYLEVRYSASLPALPSDICGETFSHVFGTNTSPLEIFLLDRRIKGPCWLDIKFPQLPSPVVSWCKVEAVAVKPDHVSVVAGLVPPPVVVMTMGMRTTVNPKTHQNEIAMVSCLVHQDFPLDKAAPQPPFQLHFCAMSHPSDVTWPWDLKDALPRYRSTKIEKMETERALLGFLLAKIHKIDPDIVVGHDIYGFDLNVLLHRVNANKIPHWSRLGRLRRTQMPKLTGRGFAERSAMCGRLVCDVKLSSMELIRAKSYELAPLVNQVLRIPESECKTLTVDEVKKMYESSSSLLQLVTMTMQDASYVLRLMCELNVLPLALQITNIAGNVMSRTLLGGRSERNEFLLLHAFTEKNFIPPDKHYGKANQKVDIDEDHADGEETGGKRNKGRRKPAYTGGLVLDPKKGFYDKFILLMDFNSLYPSIIQEYNICFTTMAREFKEENKEGEEEVLPDLPDPELEAGVLPTEIRKLVESRRQVKQLMKQPDISNDLKLQYDIRQKALKLTANSMYGCLGFSYSRFFARHLAALVTGKGREILLHTRDLVRKLNFDVIYGDTDSIMINTNCTDYEQVQKLGHKIKSEVNKLYKLLELEVDGVFKYMLLLKKKKYAALTVTKLPNGQTLEEQELKGLDIVRRDWSQLASDCGRHIVQQILSDQGPDERIENIHSHLEKLKNDLNDGKIGLDLLSITKSLTKNPEDYPDKKSLPHVQVALRMNSRGGKKLRQGDTVQYVICEDGSNLAATQRAYHVDELKTNSALVIDKNYYLAHQIHPVVSRLLDPIEGTDAARIAECLGLDPSGYRVSKQYGHGEEEEDMSTTEIPDEERYRMCERFTFQCPGSECDTIITMDSPFRGVGTGMNLEVALQNCPNPKCNFPIYSRLAPIINKLNLDIRKHIIKYYNGWLICEDPGCSNRTRRIPLRFSRGFPICNACEKGVLFREYTESQLYKQLCFYDYIFDFQKACQKNKDERIRDDTLRKAYNILQTEVQKKLKHNAYSEVNLTKLFGSLMAKSQTRVS